jgi:Spy/CpxP family protein refolding chaperone
MMNDQSADRDAMRTKMRDMMTKQQDDIKALLTDEQKKIFEKNVTDMAARRSAGGGRPPRS